MIRRPPRSPLFPYTTLSRSHRDRDLVEYHRRPLGGDDQRPADDEFEGHRGPAGQSRIAVEVDAEQPARAGAEPEEPDQDRKSTRLNSSHLVISYAVFCLKKK